MVTPSDKDDVLRYALFSRLAYIDFEITQRDMNTIPTQAEALAFLDGQTQTWLFQDNDKRELVISFRGSDSLGDLVANIAIWPVAFMHHPCKVHAGYLDYYKAVRSAILEHVMKHIKRKGESITVCGHSLGGMCACLCALDVAMIVNVPVKCFTYGAPPGADRRFYELLSQRTAVYKQVVHCHDFAPHMPSLKCFQFHNHHPASLLKLHHPVPVIKAHSKTGPLKRYIRYHSIDSYIGVLRRTII